MLFRRCPFCHRWVFRWFYDAHEKKHTERRADGQMTEHVTAPPEERLAGSLDGVPRAYRHAVCRVVTGMPEEIIRTYLVNPMAYSDGSFCCGCGDYIDSSRLVWQETGETVMDYMGRLRIKYLRDELGMDLPDRPTDLVVTPRAARQVEGILREVGPFAVLVLRFPEAGSTDYKLDAAESHNTATETVVQAAWIKVAVAHEHRDDLAGLVIDFMESPQRGFAVVRLFAPG